MECADITVRGFNAHYNKRVTFTDPELEVEGLYRIIRNENTLESLFESPVFANICIGTRGLVKSSQESAFCLLTVLHILKRLEMCLCGPGRIEKKNCQPSHFRYRTPSNGSPMSLCGTFIFILLSVPVGGCTLSELTDPQQSVGT